MDNNNITDSNTEIRGDEVTVTKDKKLLTKYMDSASDVLETLNDISPSMCMAKWLSVSMHLPTGRTQSCYHPQTHKIPLDELKNSIKALHNTKYKKEQRQKMLNGERPAECSFCWAIEDSGSHLSDRAYRSADVWSPENLQRILDAGSFEDINPVYVEVNFNQACNFRCTYCSPHLSTAWHKEVEDHGGYNLIDRTHNDPIWLKNDSMMPIPQKGNPYVEAFWKWWPDMYKDIKVFRMTGGEPLMDKNTFKVFDYVLENPRKDLQLSITSNCNPPGDQWQKFIDKAVDLTSTHSIDHFMLFCSLDTVGERAEYIRDGLDYDLLMKNVEQYLTQVQRHSLTFIITFCNLSVTHFKNYLERILTMRKQFNTDRQLIWFDVPMLTEPNWMSLQILPSYYVEMLEESLEFMKQNVETLENRFKGFKDYEISKVQRLIDWMRSPISDEQVRLGRANFHAFYTEYDFRKGKKFVDVFPEMTDFWELCTIARESYTE